MREIKFRCWDEETKTMIGNAMPLIRMSDGYYLVLLGVSPTEVNEEIFKTKVKLTFTHHESALLRKVIPMQYTGLHDKNGKEIYEGDIVKWVYDCCGEEAVCPNHSEGVQVVEITPEGFFFISPYHTLEVIGNIYENPELIR